ncbi:MAG TPA: PilZ domain-containing protein [Xanthomonadales bacterium]|nr:PilZ domain-containing protein [Xanthomonadales bacterium]
MSALPVADNRRQFRRIPFDGEVRLYSDRAMWSTRLIDISLKGALVDRPEGWEGVNGKRQRLDLRVASGLIISVAGLIAHASPRFVGYRFDKIDLDSFVRLKRLIELNLGDPEMLNRELGSLGR